MDRISSIIGTILAMGARCLAHASTPKAAAFPALDSCEQVMPTGEFCLMGGKRVDAVEKVTHRDMWARDLQ